MERGLHIQNEKIIAKLANIYCLNEKIKKIGVKSLEEYKNFFKFVPICYASIKIELELKFFS